MSDVEMYEVGPLPVGSKIESNTRPRGWLGTFTSMTRADDTLLAHAKRQLPEIANHRLREDSGVLVDDVTRARYEIRTAFVDCWNVASQSPMVTAFSVSGDCFMLALVPEGDDRSREEIVYMGSLGPVKVGSSSRPRDDGPNIL